MERPPTNAGQSIRECERGKSRASFEGIVANIGQPCGEFEGGESCAPNERIIANSGKRLREFEAGKRITVSEPILANTGQRFREFDGAESEAFAKCTAPDGVHPCRHGQGFDVRAGPGYSLHFPVGNLDFDLRVHTEVGRGTHASVAAYRAGSGAFSSFSAFLFFLGVFFGVFLEVPFC